WGVNATAVGTIIWNQGESHTVDLSSTLPITQISPANNSIINNASYYEWLFTDSATINYSLLIDDNSDFSSPEKNISDIEDLNHSLEISLDDGFYYWKVQAFDNSVFDSETSTWQFIFDSVIPNVTNLQVQPAQINVSQNANITANVVDDLEISKVLVQITDPLNRIFNYTMSNSSSLYNLTYQADIAGGYNVKIIANDTANNINDSETINFSVSGLSTVITNPEADSIFNINTSFWLNSTVSSYGFDLNNG
ncbi:unnamed protein product, partial [marine sediment metagenome]